MGQVLAIGIVTECSVSKKNLQKYQITKDELIAEMVIKKHFEPAIYDLSETDNNYVFTLQSTVIENQLLPFLEKLYPLLYSDKDFFKDTIEKLKTSEPNTWLDLAENKSAEEFQIDEYGESDYLYFDKPFQPNTSISFNSIMLSHEGKIMMETYGRQFDFFTHCIQITLSEFSLAKALKVYISG